MPQWSIQPINEMSFANAAVDINNTALFLSGNWSLPSDRNDDKGHIISLLRKRKNRELL